MKPSPFLGLSPLGFLFAACHVGTFLKCLLQTFAVFTAKRFSISSTDNLKQSKGSLKNICQPTKFLLRCISPVGLVCLLSNHHNINKNK